MITDQNHSSDSTASEQEVIRHTKKLAQIFELNEQNAEVYSALSSENRVLEKRLDDYYSQHKELKKEVNRLGKHIEGRVDCLNDDVDELFAMECCNCSKESINSSSESSPSAPNIKKCNPLIQKLFRNIAGLCYKTTTVPENKAPHKPSRLVSQLELFKLS